MHKGIFFLLTTVLTEKIFNYINIRIPDYLQAFIRLISKIKSLTNMTAERGIHFVEYFP